MNGQRGEILRTSAPSLGSTRLWSPMYSSPAGIEVSSQIDESFVRQFYLKEYNRRPDVSILDELCSIPELVAEVCKLAGKDPKDMVLMWGSPPCDTFSPAVASNIGRGPGHGYNTRDFKDPERGPCCENPNCKYAQQAKLHDTFLPLLQGAVAHGRAEGLDFHFAFENPRGSLRYRPYMQLGQWPDGQWHCL